MRRLAVAAVAAACSGSGARPHDAAVARLPDAPAPDAARARSPIAGANQLLLGIADGWDATTVTLQRYELMHDDAGWRAFGPPIVADLGQGLAWGRGRHGDGAPTGRTGPIKREGDLRSPAGAFDLDAAFGYDATAPGKLPYTQVDADWRCVDDPRSSHYNRVLDSRGVADDWQSAEVMRRDDELYRRVVEIVHNRDAAPGGGSCVFLHVWSGPRSPTVGCTAMAAGDLETLLGWFRPGAVYVLLPRDEASALRAAWGLPQSAAINASRSGSSGTP